ncbi:hypothetical protein V6N12_053879 [Hibiscus sabdariffa]|uniref:Uncharacterized protein n=1 Tax=Hibiscus sabdariffa TaxID=183260 RepID=A0ABR2D8W3_9ROSI
MLMVREIHLMAGLPCSGNSLLCSFSTMNNELINCTKEQPKVILPADVGDILCKGFELHSNGMMMKYQSAEGFPGFCKWFSSIREVCLSQNHEEGLCQLSFLCWHLWKARNKWIFSGIKEEPIDVWKASDCAFLEFSSVVLLNPSSHSSRPLNEGAWTPPPNEWIKANCDASWFSCSQIAARATRLNYCPKELDGFSATKLGWPDVI